MKLTVEITEKDFIYSWEIGEEKQNSTTPVTAEGLCLFTRLLEKCAHHWGFTQEEKLKKTWAKMQLP